MKRGVSLYGSAAEGGGVGGEGEAWGAQVGAVRGCGGGGGCAGQVAVVTDKRPPNQGRWPGAARFTSLNRGGELPSRVGPT